MVPIQAELRTNVTLRPQSGSETKINSPGSAMTSEELGEFLDAVSHELDHASDVVISGSGPAGAPTSLHADIVVLARAKGVRALVDTSGAPLRECLNALPDVVAPNLHELAELTQASVTTVADVVSAAETILARGVSTVVVSMGPLGALLANHSTMLWGSAEDVTVVNAVGAGDARLAGLRHAVGRMLHATSLSRRRHQSILSLTCCCGGCSAAVKRMLAARPDVESAAVNLITETAAVRFRSIPVP
jgi:1-phosphofructokinase family hexose kinase